jgi:hypothetical protein
MIVVPVDGLKATNLKTFEERLARLKWEQTVTGDPFVITWGLVND